MLKAVKISLCFRVVAFSLILGLTGWFQSPAAVSAVGAQTQEIDPEIVYSSYVGGEDADSVADVATDKSGNVYLCLVSDNNNSFFIDDLRVVKFDPRGQLVYVKLIGQVTNRLLNKGVELDQIPLSIAVDNDGNAYIGGHTDLLNFPVTVNALFGSLRGGLDGVVVKLNPTGSISYSSYFGGLNDDMITDIAVDDEGGIYVTGGTESTASFPILNAAQPTQGGGQTDAFVVKIDSVSGKLVYSTFLGGVNDETGQGIKVDKNGSAYVTGETISVDTFPFVNGLVPDRIGGSFDGFITKISPSGSGFVYSTRIIGNEFDSAHDIAIDNLNNVYICGVTRSTNFRTVNPFQAERRGNFDSFIFALNIERNEVLFSSYFGGDGSEQARGLSLDDSGNPYIVGVTDHPFSFPVLKPFQQVPTDPETPFLFSYVFVAKFKSDGTLLYSSLLGGSRDDFGNSVAVNGVFVWVAGQTYSRDFPTTGSAFQINYAGGGDGFITKISEIGRQPCVVTCNASAPQFAEVNKPVSFSASVEISGDCDDRFSTTWIFGDDSRSFGQLKVNHTYAEAGIYTWKFLVLDDNDNVVCISSGQITIGLLPCSVPSVVMESLDQTTLLGKGVTISVAATGSEPLTFRWFRRTGSETVFLGSGNVPRFNLSTSAISFGEYYASASNDCGVSSSTPVKIAVTDKYPIVFLPGIAGSVLKGVGSSPVEYWPGPTTSDDAKERGLSLDPNDPRIDIVATDIVRSVLGSDVYGSFLDSMKDSGYRENGVSEKNPTLYLLPYDWRLSSKDNIAAVEKNMAVIKQRYPKAPVNVIAHSMGGLLVRAYILAHPSDNGITKFISVASPWLGTPKGISIVFDGQFMEGFIGGLEQKILIGQDSLKKLAKFWPAIHELMPSRSYHDLAGRLVIFRGFDQNGNKLKKKQGDLVLNYDQTMSYLNANVQNGVGDNNRNFHSQAQDDERGNAFGVDYYHIVGKTSADKTITVVVFTGHKSKKKITHSVSTESGQGDGTVALISAKREGMNQSEDSGHLFIIDETKGSFEHTSLLKHPEVQKTLTRLLTATAR